MSGGCFDYLDSRLKQEIFGWSDKCRNVLEDVELSELIWDVLDLLHDYDWYVSGDTGEDTWLKAKSEFKKKWFEPERIDIIRRTIDHALEDCREELHKTYDIKDSNEVLD